MWNPRKLIFLTSMLGLLILMACPRESKPPLRLGILEWPPYMTFFLASELGYYDDVAVELVEYSTPAGALRAYQNGALDGVALTTDFLLQLSSVDPKHRAVLVIDASLGGDALLSQKEFKNVDELEARKIGLEMSTLGQLMLTRALAPAGLTPKQVELVFLDIPDHYKAFVSREIDAVVTYDPVRTQLLAQGASLLFDSSQIPNEIVDVMIVDEMTLSQREQTLRDVLGGYFLALEYLQKNPKQAASMVAFRVQLSEDAFLDTLKLVHVPNRAENQSWLKKDGRLVNMNLKQILPVLIENKKVEATLELDSLVDDRLVQAH